MEWYTCDPARVTLAASTVNFARGAILVAAQLIDGKLAGIGDPLLSAAPDANGQTARVERYLLWRVNDTATGRIDTAYLDAQAAPALLYVLRHELDVLIVPVEFTALGTDRAAIRTALARISGALREKLMYSGLTREEARAGQYGFFDIRAAMRNLIHEMGKHVTDCLETAAARGVRLSVRDGKLMRNRNAMVSSDLDQWIRTMQPFIVCYLERQHKEQSEAVATA